MNDQASTYAALADRFPASSHKTKTIGGRALTYVDGEMVISRLNEVLGIDGWSFEVKDVKVLDNEVWALGRMTVYQSERTIVREQAGGQIINRNKAGEIIELGNDIKGAVTDCVKKCASLLGVGLYLFNVEERREVEAEMRDAKRPTPLRPTASEPRPSTPARPVQPQPEPAAQEVTRARAMQDTPMTGTSRPQLIAALATNIRSQREAGADVRMPTGEQLKGLTDDDLQKMVTDTAAALAAS